MTFTHAESVKQ